MNTECVENDFGCDNPGSYLLYALISNSSVSTPCEGQGFCYIYDATNSSLGWSGGVVGGISGADLKCAAEIPGGPPVSSTYRAMLMAAGVRTQTLDWVLYANMEYRLQNGSTILGSTNSAAVFTFPLTNALGAFGNMWTGISVTSATVWTPGNDCGAWMGGASGVSGDRSDAATNFVEANPALACGSNSYLYCVQR